MLARADPRLRAAGGDLQRIRASSAYSDLVVEHARRYVEDMIRSTGLGTDSFVVEIVSNDGYLLQHFLPKGVPVAESSRARTSPRRRSRAASRRSPSPSERRSPRASPRTGTRGFVLGNNVLAQVPDINDFAAGVAALLARDGTATFEFPHLAKLVEHLEYDTIYHEHFSYFSLLSIRSIFGIQGLELIDVQELPSHGGSLRVFLRHHETGGRASAAVADVLALEEEQGLRDPASYAHFAEGVRESKRAPLRCSSR